MYLTNQQFATENKAFIQHCKNVKKLAKVEILPTSRQASKYRNKKGLAWAVGRLDELEVPNEPN